jgi:hypothetical protein
MHLYRLISLTEKHMKYLALIAIGLLPGLSFAATYHYVNTSGEIAAVEAQNAQTALVTAPNIAYNSGVAIDNGLLKVGKQVTAFGYVQPINTGLNTYHFVNTSGYTDSVVAASAQIALMIAPNIAYNSGVAIDRGLIEDGQHVESVR